MTVSPPNNIADLGDVTYQPSLTHRVTDRALGQRARAPATNTPTGATSSVASVPMTHSDQTPSTTSFPATGAQVTRERLLARDRLRRQLRGLPPPARRRPGVEREERPPPELPRRQPQRNPVLRGLPHRPAHATASTEAPSPRTARSATFTRQHAARRRPRRSATCRTTSTRSTWAVLVRRRTTTTPACSPTETLYPQDIRNCTYVPRRLEHVAHRPDRRTATTGRTMPTARHAAPCHDGIDFATATGMTLKDEAAGLTQTEHQRHRACTPPRARCRRRLAVRAVPQVERHLPAGRHRPEPLPGDAAESRQRAWRSPAATQQHELRLDRLGRSVG
mgnify:CR=1 FL=1